MGRIIMASFLRLVIAWPLAGLGMILAIAGVYAIAAANKLSNGRVDLVPVD
jgi:hypothetical protein